VENGQGDEPHCTVVYDVMGQKGSSLGVVTEKTACKSLTVNCFCTSSLPVGTG
jgi:hypothetical protein